MVKRIKKLTDPNAPKRPALPFIRWRSESTKRIINSMKPGFTRQDLGKKYSEGWGSLTEAEKKPFEDSYNADRVKFMKLQKAYKLTAKYAVFQNRLKEHKIVKEKSTRFPKDENAPKKALSGYFMFLGANREQVKEEHTDLTHKEQLKKLGEMWSALTEDGKATWNKKAAKGKAEYEKKLAAYKKTAQYTDYQTRKEEFEASKKTKVKKLTAKLEPKSPKKAKKVKSSKKEKVSKKKRASKKKKAKQPKAPKRAASAKKVRKRTKARKAKRAAKVAK